MDSVSFNALVDQVGAKNIISIVFDNAGRETFGMRGAVHPEFTKNMIQGELLVFEHYDMKNNKFLVYKPIETVQGVIVADSDANRSTMDARYVTF